MLLRSVRCAILCSQRGNRSVATTVTRLYSDNNNKELKNTIKFGGVAKRDGASVSLHRNNLIVQVVPNKGVSDDFKAVENEMLVTVSGKLCSRTSVVERGGRFTYQKQHFIQAEGFEILKEGMEVS